MATNMVRVLGEKQHDKEDDRIIRHRGEYHRVHQWGSRAKSLERLAPASLTR